MNKSGEELPYGVDEFTVAGLTKEKGKVVDVPMVKESPIKVRVLLPRLISTHAYIAPAV